MFVWYEVWLIFLTSLSDCRSFHIRDLIEFQWQVSLLTKILSTSMARKMQLEIETLLKYVFILINQVILCTKGLNKKMICF